MFRWIRNLLPKKREPTSNKVTLLKVNNSDDPCRDYLMSIIFQVNGAVVGHVSDCDNFFNIQIGKVKIEVPMTDVKGGNFDQVNQALGLI